MPGPIARVKRGVKTEKEIKKEDKKETKMSSGSSRSAAKRLLRELAVWEKEAPAETGIERLGPVSEDELLRWEAVINGRGIGAGYD
ncbi:hypothetical protein CHU98_g11439, partial [Xylaria longipes]